MTMTGVDRYFEALSGVLEEIRLKEAASIERVGRLAAETISKKGMLHVYDTGHMLTSEMMGRAGGLLAWSPLSFSFGVNNPGRHRDREAKPAPKDFAELIALALARSNVREGDIVFVGSVSGKTPNPVEMVLQAKAKGATVIGLTSVEHSRVLEGEHPSGKRLFEVADIVLDNHAPPGDAMIEVPGFERRVCPASGMAAAAIMWAVNCVAVQALAEMGIAPAVYSSVNLPGGPEDVRATEELYASRGY